MGSQPNTKRRLAPSERLMGSQVVLRLRSGKVLSGKYVHASRYEVELITDRGRAVVFKHAIDWMAAANGFAEGAKEA